MRILRYVAVDDCGTMINPMVVEGQVHGGIAHGIGNALLEEVVYDGAGQLATGTLMDYALPRATDVPALEVHHVVTPRRSTRWASRAPARAARCRRRPPSPTRWPTRCAPLGVEITEMPLTRERLWRLTRSRRGRGRVLSGGSAQLGRLRQ